MIISVASGKGGTGKTLVATSLALSLGEDVQLLDCDVEGPNAHLLLQPTIVQSETASIRIPKVNKERCTYCGECARVCAYHAIAVLSSKVMVFPKLCHGCGACTHFCPENAIFEEENAIGVVESGHVGEITFVQGRLTVGEAMSPPVIRKVKSRLQTDKTVIIDVPPGTSCPVVEAIRGTEFSLLVTEPTPFGLHDLSLAVEVVRELRIPCGVVLNRAGSGDERVEEYCHQQGIPVLMKIPLDRRIAELYSDGVTLVQGIPEWRMAFLELFHGIEKIVLAAVEAETAEQGELHAHTDRSQAWRSGL